MDHEEFDSALEELVASGQVVVDRGGRLWAGGIDPMLWSRDWNLDDASENAMDNIESTVEAMGHLEAEGEEPFGALDIREMAPWN